MDLYLLLLLALLPQGRNNPGAQRNPPQAPAEVQTPASTQDGQASGLPIIQDLGDHYLIAFDERGDSIDLEELTKMCQSSTDKNFVYDGATQTELKNKKVQMLGPKKIAKSEFYSFYQNLMFINSFSCIQVGRDDTSVVLIQSISAGGRPNQGQTVRPDPLYVPSEEVDRYAGQVATQIMTVLHLAHTDTRSLQNSLRALGNETANNVVNVGTSNSVLITGSGSTVAILARVLKLVDDEAAKDADLAPTFELIPIEFASAEDIADMLDQLMEASRRATQAARAGQAQGATAALPSQNQESKIIVDKRTQSLIVMAMPEEMSRIKELVARLDVEQVEPERTYHVYSLDNVKAEDLAKVLKDFIQDSSRVQSSAGGARGGGEGAAQGRANATSDNEVVVVPDPATNSLLIAAGKTRYEEVLDLIRKLDHRQDQVLIETALIELTGRDFRDLGVELGLADLPSAGGDGSFGVTSFGLSTLIDSDDDGQLDTRVPTQTDGLTGGILSGDDFSLPVLLVAIQELRDSNVLNVPSVLVNNNGSAKVTSIDEQPTTTVTLGGSGVGGTQESFKGYEKAGITMEISPSISASGYLRLKVFLEVSQFLGTFSGAIPPPRITRTIDTTVNVPDGDTMVIGGIITDNMVHTEIQTPWLGDIPILGYLFQRESKQTDRTTLYFFVTPHILRDKEFADLAELSYKVKLNAAEVIGASRVKMIDENFNASPDPLESSGFDVPLYRSPPKGEVDGQTLGLDRQKQNELLERSVQESAAPVTPTQAPVESPPVETPVETPQVEPPPPTATEDGP